VAASLGARATQLLNLPMAESYSPRKFQTITEQTKAFPFPKPPSVTSVRCSPRDIAQIRSALSEFRAIVNESLAGKGVLFG
jgi:hypothetical protein